MVYCDCRCVVLRLFRAVWAAALAGGGPQTSGCRRACPAGCARIQVLCHSERSEESFPLRTKGRLRTMPSKEERDKRSAVKNLSTHTFIQILRRSSDLLRMTMLSCIESFPFGNSFKCSPGPAAGVASLMRAGPGRKVFRIRKRTDPAGHACHNCHSERSEESILGKVTDSSSLCSSE